MKKIAALLVFTAAVFFVTAGFARNAIMHYSITNALTSDQAKNTGILGGMNFYFGNQEHPKVLNSFGQVKSNRKTNAFMKSDFAACQWAFFSSLKSLRAQAVKRGANAVINIKSNYQNNLVSSDTKFTCGSGAVVAGVALVGTAVKLAK